MALTYGFCLGSDTTLYTAKQFSEAVHKAFGDGVCEWGKKFETSVNGLSLTVGTGFGLVAGHWVKNDEPLQISVQPGPSHTDRTDLLVLQADEKARTATLALLPGTAPDALPDEPYIVPLYSLHVQRGATSLLPDDLTDLRAFVPPLSAVSADALRAYDFVSGGIDREIARILGLSQQVVDKGSAAIEHINAVMENKNAGPGIGELQTAHDHPLPVLQWLLCDGRPVPAAYPALSALLGGTLPHIIPDDSRFPTYIFAGKPQEGEI